jgi:hypothetical protein
VTRFLVNPGICLAKFAERNSGYLGHPGSQNRIKKMKRLGIVLFGLIVALAQPLSAQDYAPDLQDGTFFTYTFSQTSGIRADWNGINVGPQVGKVGHVAWNSPTSPSFTLYCVDYDHTIWRGYQVNALVSTVGTGDISGTLLGSAGVDMALERYQAAAWLASQFHTFGPASYSAIQTTIWAITTQATLIPFWATETYMTDPDGTNWAEAVENAYLANWYGMDFGNWHVLTAYDRMGQGIIPRQEMLAQTQTVTPEPQTYVLLVSGLLFMAFFGRRRLKEMGYL